MANPPMQLDASPSGVGELSYLEMQYFFDAYGFDELPCEAIQNERSTAEPSPEEFLLFRLRCCLSAFGTQPQL